MPQTKHILFIQYRAHKAGAQTSLFRLVKSLQIDQLLPAVLLSEDGWISNSLKNNNIPTFISQWPSPRSFYARTGGLNLFAKRVVKQLVSRNISPSTIVANDHQECPLALHIGKLLECPVTVILRSSGMTLKDYTKYQCDQCDEIFAVGIELLEKVNHWTSKDASIYTEGFLDEEMQNSHSKLPSEFPSKVLVVGTEDPAKGIPDFLQALKIVEQNLPHFPETQFVFTCAEPAVLSTNAIEKQSFRSSLVFHGRVDNLHSFAKQFDFAIHPSRRETFGMAPIELILSGIPTLSTMTGILSELEFHESWLAKTSSPESLANKLTLWSQNWQENASHTLHTQRILKDQFNISSTTIPFKKSLIKHLKT